MQTATFLLLLLLAQPGAAGPPSASAEALLVETAFGPALRTDSVPPGHYAERYPDGAWWLPGVDEGTSLVRKVIRAARAARDTGQPVALETHVADGRRVFVTDAPPFPGVFWLRAGDRHLWIAGVDKPREADLQTLHTIADHLEAPSPDVATR